jgi:winged helix DNA-binding protein
MRTIGVEERRARLARRHHLAPAARASGPVEVAGGLVALHATDPATVFLAVAARMRLPENAAVERALYEERALVRMLGMRRTMFVVRRDLVGVVHASSTRAIAALERRRTLQLLEGSGIGGDLAAWLAGVEEATLAALAARGEATGAELSADVPGLRTRMLLAEGKPYQSLQNITTRVLTLLAADGRIVRGRPRGSWISSQYRWSPLEAWLPGGVPEWTPADARAELVRRWLAAYGPGTEADLRWWTGWTAAHVRAAVAAAGAVEVDLDGTAGLVLSDDVDPEPVTEPWVGLLPALDPTVMGWAGRDWYLGEHGPALFDRSGNAGPTVWCDGRVVGGWAQPPGGGVAVELLEDVGAEAAAAVEVAAGALGGWLGEVRVTPRFRTPLERRLSS